MSWNPHQDAILVLNSGSSSLKFGVFVPGSSDEELLFSGEADGIGRDNGNLRLHTADGGQVVSQSLHLESQSEALQNLTSMLRDHLHNGPIAVGHRIVHGGPALREHQRITPKVFAQLEAAVHFAPLHIPAALSLIQRARNIFPQAIQLGCFDTAFHRTLPEIASRLPLPQRYADQGVMRYGFHGLSYESVLHKLGPGLPKRLIIAHLGGGSSLCAVLDGKPTDTSMGFTPAGGVPMGTRSGDLDPGVFLFLMRNENLDATQLETLINHQSGLIALSGGESDMRSLLRRVVQNDGPATLAVDLYCTSVRKCIGSYTALLGGVDLLVFTGGIGENSDVIRKQICEGLDFLELDQKIRVMKTEEEVQIARHCRQLLRNY